MRTLRASETGLAEVIAAARSEPVVLRRQIRGRQQDVALVPSVDAYGRLAQQGKVAEFQRFCDHVGADAKNAGMTEAVLEELLQR